MAISEDFREEPVNRSSQPIRLASFQVNGLFNTDTTISIEFPRASDKVSNPSIIIISGENGSGKTTFLRMLNGIIELNFDEFSKIPFSSASLLLSDVLNVHVAPTYDADFPLHVVCGKYEATLSRIRLAPKYSKQQAAAVEAFRGHANPSLKQISFELLQLDRATRQVESQERDKANYEDQRTFLGKKVYRFLRDAQIDYHRFFRTEELEFLPRLLQRLDRDTKSPSLKELSSRVAKITGRIPAMEQYGLAVDFEALSNLSHHILNGRYIDGNNDL